MKITETLKTLAFIATLVTSGVASATTTDWGTVAPGTTLTKTLSVPQLGSFADYYNVALLTSGSAALKRSITITLDEDANKLSGFTGLAYGLYSSLTNSLIPSTYDALSKTYSYDALSAGAYFLKISGIGYADPGVEAPKYNALVSITAAVPEPESYTMLLAGLGLMGVVVRRRSQSS
jgi:hypothetical protein